VQIALISDIHGNIEALDAVLSDIDQRFPDAKIICTGDIVGYGPDPGTCIERLVSRAIPGVMGNHDEMVLGQRDFSRCVYAGIRAARWTRRILSEEHLSFLHGLPGILQVTPNIVACHGTPEDADVYVSNETVAEQSLAHMKERYPDAKILVCGHTHHAAVYCKLSGFRNMGPGTEFTIPARSHCIINPGAVGQSRDGKFLARYAILDTETAVVSFPGLVYDQAMTVRKLRRAGLVPAVDLQRPTGLLRYFEAFRRRWARFWRKSNSQFA
jgi:predicted phosphodiesterase